MRSAEGWHSPPGSRKFHWFIDSGLRSLCGRWGFASGADLQPATDRSGPDDCAACLKKLIAHRATPETGATE